MGKRKTWEAQRLPQCLLHFTRNDINAFYLQVCGQVALAAVDRSSAGLGSAGASGSGSGFRGGLDEGLMEGTADDEEDAGGVPGSSPGAAQLQAPPPEQIAASSQSMHLSTAPRLRTRLFAAR